MKLKSIHGIQFDPDIWKGHASFAATGEHDDYDCLQFLVFKYLKLQGV